MGRKLLKTVQTMTTFRNPLARGSPWEPIVDPPWSADPSLKTAALWYVDQTENNGKRLYTTMA